MPVKENIERSVSSVKKRLSDSKGLARAIFKHVKNKRNRVLITLILETGMTPREIINVKHSDIHIKEKILIIQKEYTKNKKRRVASLRPTIVKELKDYSNQISKETSSFLFSTKKSKQMDVRTVQRIVKDFSIKSNIDLTSVELRKSCIIRLLKEKPVEDVKKEVGLKRLDIREYLSYDEIKKIKSEIKSSRDSIIFNLLLEGIKSHTIVNLTVRSIDSLNISHSLTKLLKSYVIEKKLFRHDYVFLTRQKSHLTNERIFQIITQLGSAAGVRVNPRILNNTALAAAFSSKNSKKELENLSVSSFEIHLHGGFLT